MLKNQTEKKNFINEDEQELDWIKEWERVSQEKDRNWGREKEAAWKNEWKK